MAEEMGRSPALTKVVSTSYNQVMLQFEALGMVEYIECGLPGWVLTARGRRMLASSFALRRG